jgi:hypothetical protein
VTLLRRIDDRIVALGIKAKQIPRLLHVRRQQHSDLIILILSA